MEGVEAAKDDGTSEDFKRRVYANFGTTAKGRQG